MKDRGIVSLSAFYVIYYAYLGIATFGSKYFAEIGLNESQIGVLTSAPALISMCFMPMWGSAFDRARVKKRVLALVVALSALILLGVDALTDFGRVDSATGRVMAQATKFWPLFGLLTASMIFGQPVLASAASIAIEYTQTAQKSYGPIRMLGTAGYQVGVLLVGAICAVSLRHLYTYQALVMLGAAAAALTLPNIRGRQTGAKKLSAFVTLRDRRVRTLLAMTFVATCSTMFYQSLFGAFLESMGISNAISSIITWVSVILELPVLFFATRLYNMKGVWGWMRIGFVLNAIRWIGFFISARAGSWQLLMLFQIPAVSAMACFEFFPQLYLGRIAAPELSSSAQSMLNITSFGAAKVVGGLLGGFISQKIGLDMMYLVFGVILTFASVAIWPVCRRMTYDDAREETAK